MSFAAFTAALRAHPTTADDILAVNGLPSADPSNGLGFFIPTAEARVLGLAARGGGIDDTVTLNSDLPFSFGQDAVGALLHEITEGVFGRVASLALDSSRWAPLDLFRFTATGQRDFTGGADGQATFFGLDAAHVTGVAFHNPINGAGVSDGFDLGDWSNTRGDAFGPGGPSSPGVVSATDLRLLDILGWTDVILGNLGNDTLHAGSGNDVLRGGQGDDVIFGGPGHDFISGDLGNNTETGGSGPDTFHSFAAVTLDLITNFNEAKGDRVQLDPGTVYTVSQSGADTVISMVGGGNVVLQGVEMTSLHAGWIFEG